MYHSGKFQISLFVFLFFPNFRKSTEISLNNEIQ